MLENSQKLLDGLMQRNPDVQKWFWENHFDELRVICLHICRDPVRATDIAVDLLTDFMFDHVRNIENPRGIHAYLRLMAVRRSVRQREQVASQVMFDETHSTQIAPQNVMNTAENHLLYPKLEKCLESLTPKAQATVRLKYARQMTDREIGDVVGGSKQYIGKLLGNSLALLRDCINGKRVRP